MHKILTIIMLMLACLPISATTTSSLSSKGHTIIAKHIDKVVLTTPINKAEKYVDELISYLPYEYKWNQNFIDGMIITCAIVGQPELKSSLFYERMKKCRLSDGKMYMLDYKFTIAAIRDNMEFDSELRMDIYKHMAVDVLAFEEKHSNDNVFCQTDANGNPMIYADARLPKGKAAEKKKAAVNTQPAKRESKASAKNTSKKSTNSSAKPVTKKSSSSEYIASASVSTSSLKCSANGKSMIKKFEGCVLTAYWDCNGYSIGYGHHHDVHRWDKITHAQADAFFDSDIKGCEAAARRLINDLPYKYNFSQGFMDGMCSLIYNCGSGNVSRSKFYKALKKCKVNSNGEINRKDYDYAISLVKKTCVSHPAHKGRRQKEYECMKMK